MTAKIKLNAASGGGSFSLQAPSSSSNNRVFTLPDTADATMATVNGITEVDQYRMSSNVTSSGNNATITVWERMGTSIHAASAVPHGTGMSVSSGIFTFPITGKYLIILKMAVDCGVDDNVQIYIKITTNNSSYTTLTGATDGQNGGSGTRAGSGTAIGFIDVTDVGQVKVLFHADSIGSNSQLKGGTAEGTDVIFIRLGDT
tara:strand:+ start:1005 stop:1610 length:606 start_codon:yes stop_codon:yes gene_type:complete